MSEHLTSNGMHGVTECCYQWSIGILYSVLKQWCSKQ